MAAAEFLADPAELATFLGLPADDVRLLAALRAATRRFRGAVRHPVSLVTDDTAYLDGTGRAELHLPAAPVVQLHSVHVDGVELTGVRAKRRAGVLLHPSGCWPAWSEVAVAYDHGHDPVPDEVAEAVIDQARAIYRLDPAIQQITTGTESVSFAATAAVGITSQWQAAVEAHRLNRGDEA
ncbi:mobile element protein [Streptomyces sp. MBT56]|uniref:mobile element protein n=1 Tax=unclassified Streptomyces TaxID=2593676 RepID=UPI00190BFBD8|nr:MULTISPECIES: mobile element protein [unclassified Streptomyces]MBK3561091.1 mobile element protein [Streptomyces sp. MBT56]MBK3602434.1 mobile element protein [Streptomyces sp. MBT54]MBK3615477.1 mobile element protein [Streptomyces sp. MBT98]